MFYRFPRSVKYLIIKHAKGHWALPKGHRDKGETKLETALRELYEETGIKKLKLISKKIVTGDRYVIKKKEERINKTVEYYIAESLTEKVRIDKNEITAFRWCTVNGAEKLITFPQTFSVLKKANKQILKYLQT